MNFRAYKPIVFIAILFCLFSSTAQSEIPPAPSMCQTTTEVFSNNTPMNIPDGALAISEIIVDTDAGLSIFDVNLTTFIQHPNSGDLALYLIPPAGKVIVLTTDNGTGFGNVYNGTVFDDDAGNTNPPGAVTDTTMANGVAEPTVVPESAMATMVGTNPNGKWKLYVYDKVAGNVGALNGWSLQITTVLDSPTTESLSVANNTPVNINDVSTVQSTIQFPSSMTVYEVRLHVMAQHTYASDLDITLQSPSGTVVTITTDNGGSLDDVFADTWFSDKGWYPITDIDYTIEPNPDSAIPEEAMGAFIGENALGTWTLSITDDSGSDAGVLNGWALEIVSATCGTSLLYDGFNDGIPGADWDFVKGTWTESNGEMHGNPGSKTALAFAQPPSGPCNDCSVHTVLSTSGGAIDKLSLLAWYNGPGDRIELLRKADTQIWLLKEYAGGVMVKKMKFNELTSPETPKDIRLEYNSADNSVTFYRENYPYGTMQLSAVHTGIFGVKTKGSIVTVGAFSIQTN